MSWTNTSETERQVNKVDLTIRSTTLSSCQKLTSGAIFMSKSSKSRFICTVLNSAQRGVYVPGVSVYEQGLKALVSIPHGTKHRQGCARTHWFFKSFYGKKLQLCRIRNTFKVGWGRTNQVPSFAFPLKAHSDISHDEGSDKETWATKASPQEYI